MRLIILTFIILTFISDIKYKVLSKILSKKGYILCFIKITKMRYILEYLFYDKREGSFFFLTLISSWKVVTCSPAPLMKFTKTELPSRRSRAVLKLLGK